jgi:hypothetical protein
VRAAERPRIGTAGPSRAGRPGGLRQDEVGEADSSDIAGDIVTLGEPLGEPLGSWRLGDDVGVVAGGPPVLLFIVSSHQTRSAITRSAISHPHQGTPCRRRTVMSLRSVMGYLLSLPAWGDSLRLGHPM